MMLDASSNVKHPINSRHGTRLLATEAAIDGSFKYSKECNRDVLKLESQSTENIMFNQ